MSRHDAISEAIENRVMSRIVRESIESGYFDGYILDATRELLLLAIVNETIHLDGFTVLRVADITDMEVPTPFWEFQEKALELRGENHQVCPPVDLTSMNSTIRSISEAYPLITIHREHVDPDVCHIGQAMAVSEEWLHLKPITPAAEWKDELESHRVSEITRVDFDGQYEDALLLVGGEPIESKGKDG